MYRQCNMCNSFCQDNDNTDNNCNNDMSDMFEGACKMQSMPCNTNHMNQCSCGFESSNIFPNTLLYGHSYVPHQYMNNVYTSEYGLKMGSIFPELVSPYCPGQSQEIMNYLRKSKDFEGGCL